MEEKLRKNDGEEYQIRRKFQNIRELQSTNRKLQFTEILDF
jgi:hypothetical protein